MTRLSALVLGHKRLVVLFWLTVTAAGLAATPTISSHLSQQFALPGQPGYQANLAILRSYHNGGTTLPLVGVVTAPPGSRIDAPAARRALGHAFARVASRSGVRVVSYASIGDPRLVSPDGRTSYGLVFPPPPAQLEVRDPKVAPQVAGELRHGLPRSWSVQVTGVDELAAGGDTNGTAPGVLAEALLGALGALAVLAFVFGSLLALVPLLIAAVAILTTFLLILGLAQVTEVSALVQYLVALIGLGVAIDYCLLLVTRWREELAGSHQDEQAIHRAMATAGRAVLFSGGTVAVGLVSLALLPVPLLRGIGLAGMLIPLVSVLVTLTLLPALLATAGRRIDWPRRRKPAHASGGWSAWARGVVRARWLAALAALAVLIPLGIAAFGLVLGTPRADALATTGPAHEGLVALEQAGLPTGILTPIEVLVPTGTDPTQVAGRLAGVPGVRAAVAPDEPAWRRGGTAWSASSRSPRPAPPPARRPSTGCAGRLPASPACRSAAAALSTSTSPTPSMAASRCWSRSSPRSPSCCWPARSARCCCPPRPCCSTCSASAPSTACWCWCGRTATARTCGASRPPARPRPSSR